MARCSAEVTSHCCCLAHTSIGCALDGGNGAAGPNSGGVTNNQPIIFGCIDFYSAQCDYNANENSDGSYDAALA
eukprot:SAG31_NODE_7121_length_1783_cov_2.448931_2_plen_73_part_01